MDPQLHETVVIFAVIKNDLNDGPQHPDGWTDRQTVIQMSSITDDADVHIHSEGISTRSNGCLEIEYKYQWNTI